MSKEIKYWHGIIQAPGFMAAPHYPVMQDFRVVYKLKNRLTWCTVWIKEPTQTLNQ